VLKDASNQRTQSPLAAAWRPGGLIYLAVCALALLAGLFPQYIYPPRNVQAAPLPTLSALALGQAMFILAGWPVLCLWRCQQGTIRHYATESIIEALAWLIAAAPLYLAAAWLADATALDVARTVLTLLALWPLALSAGALMRTRPALRPAVMLAMLVLAALPAVWYIWREFLGAMPADWLWDLAPVTFTWQTAASRTPALIPTPAWPPAVWLAAAAAVWTLSMLGHGSRSRRAGSSQ
jgi:hypothetical protein